VTTCVICKITISLLVVVFQVPRDSSREQALASSSGSSGAPAVHSALTCTRASAWSCAQGGAWPGSIQTEPGQPRGCSNCVLPFGPDDTPPPRAGLSLSVAVCRCLSVPASCRSLFSCATVITESDQDQVKGEPTFCFERAFWSRSSATFAPSVSNVCLFLLVRFIPSRPLLVGSFRFCWLLRRHPLAARFFAGRMGTRLTGKYLNDATTKDELVKRLKVCPEALRATVRHLSLARHLRTFSNMCDAIRTTYHVAHISLLSVTNRSDWIR
jgi:hypothetical protein